MYRRRDMLLAGTAAVVLPIWPVGAQAAGQGEKLEHEATPAKLLEAFRSPPPEARPNVFWYWIENVVTREGITADLAAMAQAGFGRAILFTIGKPGAQPPAGSYPSLTPPWWEMVEHACAEATRVGMEIAMGACDGWATAGGPWITPELSMQRLVASEAWLERPADVPIALRRPPTSAGYYRDLRVIAFPLPASWRTSVGAGGMVTMSDQRQGGAALNSHRGGAAVDVGAGGWIQFAFAEPFSVYAIIAAGPQGGAGTGLALEASQDGVLFTRIGRLAQPLEPARPDEGDTVVTRLPDQAVRYVPSEGPSVPARWFRIVFDPSLPALEGGANFAGPNGDPAVRKPPASLTLSQLVLLDEPVIPALNARGGRAWSLPLPDLTNTDLPPGRCIDPASIVDVTDRLRPDGTLDWSPPRPGRWKVVRIGHTPTGSINATGFAAGRGLECDKLNRAAVGRQYDGWLGAFARRGLRRRSDAGLTTMHVDSWECGTQTWSPVLPVEFRQRRGYDLHPYLPILAGVPLADARTVDGFLTDFRRTVGEAAADNFWGELRRLGKRDGYRFTGEAANPVFPTDGLIRAKYLDQPMGEFWVSGDDKPVDIAETIHGAHVYGHRLIGAEAFTEFEMQWMETPYSCKPLADANWAKGINQLTCHVWAAQPWTDPAHEPGMTLWDIGVFFSRTNTWWPMAKPWFDYIRRSQALLQQGAPVADIACFMGEDIPVRAYVPSNTPLPVLDGHAFDSINADALLTMMTVVDGRLRLPCGQSYALMLLPTDYRASARVLARLAALAEQGATIVGGPPRGPLGLGGGRAEAAAVRRWTARLWPRAGLNAFGHGRIGTTDDLAPLLADTVGGPDCILTRPMPPADTISPVMWTHRAGRGWDLYFFSNQSAVEQQIEATLRSTVGVAQRWDADTGVVRSIAQTSELGRTQVSFALAPCEATFIVLGAPAPILDVEADPTPTGVAQAVAGPWSATFTRGLDRPVTIELNRLQSWTALADDRLRHYAGTASYTTHFDLPTAGRWRLDLGDVAEVCRVKLNGTALATLWKPPFTVELGGAARLGRNELVVEVASTWRNRLVGDGPKPAAERRSFTVTPFFAAAPVAATSSPTELDYDRNGLFLGGGFGNDAPAPVYRGTAAGTPYPRLKNASRYGFPGGGSTAPYPDMRRRPGPDGLVDAGLLGPVHVEPIG